ncbi:unnamed protein product [Kuraishia capsulata CBS 1993]|uniref:Uncharacterized protein n=1 Tax=Kuraishia capsulata CBS 1993 TaxID=1382522 RepID=W6MUQ2_9ASCO|nr:uncharacterized protein KUCA_T00001795001 [Kuraishia capsulata CBS 1993]CDK25825.1 unnamed protein product [Kuraishia capsulata CBS 1993]
MSLPKANTPLLKPALFVHLEAEDGLPIYSESTGSMSCVRVKSGYITGVGKNHPFEAKINFGFDDIRLSPGSSTGILDCHLYGTTAKGKGLFIHYTGVVHMVGTVAEILQNKKSYMDFDDGYVTCSPDDFKIDSGAEEEWVKDQKLSGKGRFLRNSEGGLVVQYYLYEVEGLKSSL